MSKNSRELRLVLAVDFDNDLSKVSAETPIVGREEVLRVAEKYALVNPQDSDVNVLFTAVKILDELRSSGTDAEVAVVTGDSSGGVKAAIKIRNQVEELVKKLNATDAVVVIDSAEDEAVIPVVQSVIPIAGIERVIVEQLRSVEETYILIGRYLKKILEERRFSKLFLGLPGLLILSYIIVGLTPYSSYATTVVLTVLALFLLFKGFGIDEEVSKWWRASPISRLSLVLTLLALGIALAVSYITLVSYGFSTEPHAIAFYIQNTTPYFLVSAVPLIAGRMALRILRRSIRVWRDIVSLAVLGVIYVFFDRISSTILSIPEYSLRTVIQLIHQNYIIQSFVIYLVAIMGISIIMYAIEKKML